MSGDEGASTPDFDVFDLDADTDADTDEWGARQGSARRRSAQRGRGRTGADAVTARDEAVTGDDAERELDEEEIGVLSERAQRYLAQAVATMGGATRPGQERMCEAIAAAFQRGSNLIAQAGTGTGKSLGYLAPAAALAAASGRVIVSTATLGLQRQLVEKDLPALARAVRACDDKAPTFEVLKGWNHYLCKARLEGAYPADALFSAEAYQPSSGIGADLARLRRWKTQTGDRDDLAPGVSDRAWNQVSLARNRCVGRKCNFAAECFPAQARMAATSADIVVTNHAMLAVAIFSNPKILSEFDAVIVDEAHDLAGHIRSGGTVHLGLEQLNRLGQQVRTCGVSGVEELLESARTFDAVITELGDGLLPDLPPELITACSVLDTQLRRLGSALSTQKDEASVLVGNDIREMAEVVSAIGDVDLVRWIEHSRDVYSIFAAPLHVGHWIARTYGDRGRLILTSATLKAGASFDVVAHETGMGMAEVGYDTIDVGSPFSYAQQGIRYIAADLPEPGPGGVTPPALERIQELVEAADGGALCLFSSNRALEQGAEYLRAHTDLNILVQREDQLATLVKRFKTEERTCLLGTLSLWQGVDVPGQACRLVIIDRIPFPHPHNPLYQARCLDVETRGGNSFAAVSLPHAALLLAQASGRLIRSATDRGVVAILDSRLDSRRYSGYLLKTLPQMWPTTDLGIVRDALGRLRPDASQ